MSGPSPALADDGPNVDVNAQLGRLRRYRSISWIPLGTHDLGRSRAGSVYKRVSYLTFKRNLNYFYFLNFLKRF
ncbi:unnamed protein product [Fusarium graminearum]|uniref:Chromosome 1, complete genome n=1 Tax=Gibberella zeae (strain ATCC MYA-4620 / CBS 123657 / FGSC 9075 / NRRL 31084 / PH-1) TaxID=229533 RepID=A0A098CYW5_GIBZE|nr:unnamed protein product [Fusarium graminearum]